MTLFSKISGEVHAADAELDALVSGTCQSPPQVVFITLLDDAHSPSRGGCGEYLRRVQHLSD